MKKYLPKSLAGQFICLTLIAIVLSQIIAFWIFADERRMALYAASHQQILVQVKSIVNLLDKSPPRDRPAIVEAASTQQFSVTLTPHPETERSRRFEGARELHRQLQFLLNPEGRTSSERRRIRINLHHQRQSWFSWRKWKNLHQQREAFEDMWEEEEEEDWREDHDAHMNEMHEEPDHFRPPPPAGDLDLTLGISILLDDGQWLNIKSYIRPVTPLWALPSMIAMIMTALALIGIVFFMVKRVTRPVQQLVEATNKLGKGESIPPIPESGPEDIRKATRAFNEMQARLDRYISDRTRMLAAISHDLRTPITSLRIQAEFIEDEDLRNKILATLKEMQTMTEATLVFARDDARNEAHQITDLHALVDSLISDYQDMNKNVIWANEGDATKHQNDLTYSCRPVALKRAIRNLLDNSVKYAGNAKVELQSDALNFTITIRDHGPGIPSDMLDQVFEPFIRLDKARNTEDGSIGLGLSIARSVIHDHGGTIEVRNHVEGGLEITVNLPK
ncbi:MAG: ATP-binding protein [Alphaproteobacteria bacterium]|nr:ATP-binding protein [Alphaproteobacteria bacterium]